MVYQVHLHLVFLFKCVYLCLPIILDAPVSKNFSNIDMTIGGFISVGTGPGIAYPFELKPLLLQ